MAQQATGLNMLRMIPQFRKDLMGPEFLPSQSFSGWEPKRMFVRRDGERFDDVAWTWGFDSRADGRSLVAADLDGDGDLDLVLSTRLAPRVQLFENVGTGGNSI